MLEHHIAEQHALEDRFDCRSCGRFVCKQSLQEHLNSQICKRARRLRESSQFDELGFLFPEADQDCFLMTMRLLIKAEPILAGGCTFDSADFELKLLDTKQVHCNGYPSLQDDRLHSQWRNAENRILTPMANQLKTGMVLMMKMILVTKLSSGKE